MQHSNKIKAQDVLLQAAKLKDLKEADYQDSSITESDYFPFGHESYIQMIWTKMMRIRSVAETKNSKPNFESLSDSLVDIINYAAMYSAWLQNTGQDQSTPQPGKSPTMYNGDLQEKLDSIEDPRI
tara:strand:+ start:852 stop:1229 length:378 start_codon:yes stop_codon:yes gene_type:complete